MKGDFTRSTFDPKKHYHGVLQQQGRVQIDADWNEQNKIDSYRDESTASDVIGKSGAPLSAAGFEIKVTPDKKQLRIGSGHYYVDGILCEASAEVAPDAQEDLPATAKIMGVTGGPIAFTETPETGVYLAYLDVWLHHLTALERPEIRESALGGPDHATREKLMAHVKFLRVGAPGASLNCLSPFPAFDAITTPNLGKLNARTKPGKTSSDPCIINPGAGYRRLENQLYRIEVHHGGTFNGSDLNTNPTFKWSRDNGSITAKWEGLNGNDLTVSTPGRDKVTGFASGQWIELTDDTREMSSEAGLLVQITSVKGNVITINPGGQVFTYAQFPTNPKIRRWDSPGEVRVRYNPDPLSNQFLDLDGEGGIEIHFDPGTYRTGDYWLIPARTSGPTTIGDIEWPRDTTPAKNPIPQFPQGIQHHYARLALAQFNAGEWSVISDCRNLFPPLTELTALYYVSGDSQEATPDPTQPATTALPLPVPIQVGVSNGEWPVEGAQVRFTVTVGGGTLTPASGIVPTGPDGIASCNWAINATVPLHEVRAELLDAASKPVHLPVIFHARLNTAKQVSYDPAKCAHMSGAVPPIITVQDAIDFLCQENHAGSVDCCVTVGTIGEQPGDYATIDAALEDLLKTKNLRSICLELLPGQHVIEKPIQIQPPESTKGHFTVKLKGCSLLSEVLLEADLTFVGLLALVVQGLSLSSQNGHLITKNCRNVEIDGCVIGGIVQPGAGLVTADATQRILITKNQWMIRSQIGTASTVFGKSPELFQLVSTEDKNEFAKRSKETVESLGKAPAGDRAKLGEAILGALKDQNLSFTAAERKAYTGLAENLSSHEFSAAALLKDLKAIRGFATGKAVGDSPAGLALVIAAPTADTTLADNEFVFGGVSLSGPAAPTSLNPTEMKQLSGLIHAGGVMIVGASSDGSSSSSSSSSSGSDDKKPVVHLRNNRFDRIVGGTGDLGQIRTALQGNKPRLTFWDTIFLTDNLFNGADNFYAARQLSFSNNRFLGTGDTGNAVANRAICIGNSAENDFRLFVLANGLLPNPPDTLNTQRIIPV